MEFVTRKLVIVFLLVHSILMQVNAGITDTLHAIPEIEIQANRLNYYLIGASVQLVDSNTLVNYRTQSLAELLSQQSLINVNSYGPGGQSSISIRGGAAHHASVIWNGINIQSPMHGGVNFSALPVSFIDKAQIQYGGGSSLFGSGNATGSIHMAEVPGFDKGIKAELNTFAGSNNNFVQSGRIVLSNKQWGSSLKIFGQQNRNNFRFKNTEKINSPTERIEHAGYKQIGVAQSNRIIIGKNSWVSTNFWYLDYLKEIPSLMSDYNTSEATQTDRNMMYSAYYKYARNRIQLKIQSGGFYNQVQYNNPQFNISNDNHSFSLINIAEIISTLHSNIEAGLIFEQKHEKAQSGSYNTVEHRNIISAIFSIRYHSRVITATTNIRQEIVDGSLIPIVFSSGFDLYISRNISVKSQISRNYSLPTLNDLYWQNDGLATGNPNLYPETGWSVEGGIYFGLKGSSADFSSSVVAYNNQISNWIRWVPDTSDLWIPLNLQKGLSRGIELTTEFKLQYGPVKYSANIMYGYTHAVTLEAGETQMQEGDQLWYVPKHQGILVLGANISFVSMEYSQSLIGERTYDNAQGTLDPYTVGNLLIKSLLSVGKNAVEFHVSINNLWNTSYQVKKAYAMPMRQYQAGIKFTIN